MLHATFSALATDAALLTGAPMPGPRRVLICERDACTALDLADAARAGGHDVVALARCEAEALSAAEDGAPDIVVIDLHASAREGRRIAAQLLLDHGIRPIFIAPPAGPTVSDACATLWPVAVLPRTWRDDELLSAIASAPAPVQAFAEAV